MVSPENLHGYLVSLVVTNKQFVQHNLDLLEKLQGVKTTQQSGWTDKHKHILQTSLQFYYEYNDVPGTSHISDVVTESDYSSLVEYIKTDRDLNKSYVQDSLRVYVAQQIINTSIIEIAAANRKGKLDAVEVLLKVMEKAINDHKTSNEIHFASDNFDVIELIRQIHSEEEVSKSEEFEFGIKTLSDCGIYPYRGATSAWLAKSNVGKTWGAVNFAAKNALKNPKTKILFINLDDSQHNIADRIIKAMVKLDPSQEPSFIPVLHNELGVLSKITRGNLSRGPNPNNLSDKEIASIKAKMAVDVRVRTYPARTLSSRQFEVEVEKLASAGWVPDIIILDHLRAAYLGSGSYETIGLAAETFAYTMLKVAMTYNCHVSFNHQPSNTLSNITTLSWEDHAGSSKAIWQSTAFAATLNATEAEVEKGFMRIAVNKIRSSHPRFKWVHHILVAHNLKRGIFAATSAIMKGPTLDAKALDAFDTAEDLI